MIGTTLNRAKESLMKFGFYWLVTIAFFIGFAIFATGMIGSVVLGVHLGGALGLVVAVLGVTGSLALLTVVVDAL